MSNIKQTKTLHYTGPVILAVLDGVGLSPHTSGNALKRAHTEFLDRAMTTYPMLSLAASGEAVGITRGTMGNSEVGHNAIGTGQIIKQGIAKVDEAFASRDIFAAKAWREAISHVKPHDSTLHFSGIFSDGNVHSSINHLFQLLDQAHAEGVKHIRFHLVLDGRDVSPKSAEIYIRKLNEKLKSYRDNPDYQIASGGGRMVYVADRYESDWSIVKAGWDAIVHGEASAKFASALEALSIIREADPTIQDQYLPPFVIVDQNNQPVGPVHDHDAFIYIDFRADRALEIAEAFTFIDFPFFDRGRLPKDIYFAGMTEYDSDRHIPEHQLVPPVQFQSAFNEFISKKGFTQLAVSEAVKFGHITYYFNGNSYEKLPGEAQINIPSDTRPFNTRPWMKSAEITDAVLDNIKKYDFIRINYPGGDMVGHFGELEPTIVALEAIDIQLARLAKAVDKLHGILLITADHGNAEEVLDSKGHAKTSHSTNPVPVIFYDNTINRTRYRLAPPKNPGLANLASTLALLFGQPSYPDFWQPPLIKIP